MKKSMWTICFMSLLGLALFPACISSTNVAEDDDSRTTFNDESNDDNNEDNGDIDDNVGNVENDDDNYDDNVDENDYDNDGVCGVVVVCSGCAYGVLEVC